MNIHTPRMAFVPATAELIGLELDDPDALGRALGAEVPANWPPELVRDALPFFRGLLQEAPEKRGWLCWYGMVRNAEGGAALLAASGGFMGPPVEGIVEVGYSIVPQFGGQGYATEMMGALVEWAFAHSYISTVAAEALPDNAASLCVLAKLGFAQAGTAQEPGHVRFERAKP